ncbi:MAG: hypothetical protein ABJA16_13850 [Nakamurella sp.]
MIGTIGGLVSAVAVPDLLITRRELAVRAAFGGWLMSVVPPMVSASTGALLLPHPAGPARMVPTLLIVLGPLGQSITAVNLLGGVAHLALPGPEAAGLQAFAHGSRRGALFLPPAPVSR